MTRLYRADHVLLAQGWVRDALMTVAENGLITAIEHGVAAQTASVRSQAAQPPAPEHLAGFVVPGMPNAHSHAFQRAMAGGAEYRLSARDSFWTWRQAMYALANRVEPEELQIVATQLFVEMLKAGYTSVAEFHYLHRRRDGGHYDGAGLWDAVIEAAAAAGIGLTFLPTLYQSSNFGAAGLKPEQQRFATDTDWFLRAVENRLGEERTHRPALLRTGAAFHSLRAVPMATLQSTTRHLHALDPALPLHIHVAEQRKEVEDCLAATGRRPIELLLETGLVDEHWCLVHATHATTAELAGVARARAAVCVSISTEANLGDGFFESARFLDLDGRICVGSDSQATVSPTEELRWMEYQQRLRKRRRGVLAASREPHVGERLWAAAARGGAQALGQPVGVIDVGRRADWLVLDPTHPRMAGASADGALDHLVFAGGDAGIRDVMVAGRWVVKDGHHAAELPLRHEFASLMQRLALRAASNQPG
jgi:formimidoylglutamate deiminase